MNFPKQSSLDCTQGEIQNFYVINPDINALIIIKFNRFNALGSEREISLMRYEGEAEI